MKASKFSVALVTVIGLAACGGGSSGGFSGGGRGGNDSFPPPAPPEASKTRYSMANGCYAIRSEISGNYVSRESDDSYQLNAATLQDAEAFFMKPSALGQYLFYTPDELFMTPQGESVVAAPGPSDDAIWTVNDTAEEEQYALVAEAVGVAMQDDGGSLKAAPVTSASVFSFEPTVGCTDYPEMPTSVTGQTYKGNGVDKPIIGFADVHTHMGMSSELSMDDSVGPSAGGVLYGQTVHRFGVTHALEDCEDFHGPNGIRDANAVLAGGLTTHDTVGWPSFVDWPRRDYLTHQVMYYKWVERAWLAGQRLIVNHGTNIAGLCEFGARFALSPTADCNDMSIAVKQVHYLYDIQDYIDAQYGGPGEGWFRIVKSPQEAREVINDGKMAVVLGVEVAQVFNCGVTFLPGGTELRECDESQIDEELEMLWELGVRHIYPYHDIDSSLGGAGIFSGDVINMLNFYDTGSFWKTTDCREWDESKEYVRKPGSEMTTSIPGSGNDPVSSAFLDFTNTLGILPVYAEGRHCNARDVTDLGKYAIRAIMDRGMVVDIDHAAFHSKDIILDIAEEQVPAYPVVSSHDGHGGIDSDQAERILAGGGIIYPYKGSGRDHVAFMDKLRFWYAAIGVENPVLSLGYGADANGFGGHAGPRGGDAEDVQYPFTLFAGDDWDERFAGIDPVLVDILTIPQSSKYWHIDEVGMAHYGMVADFVEEVRIEGGAEAVNALFNSAEAYVQMWERTYYRNGNQP